MEVNNHLAGLADHKFNIGGKIVWADTIEKAAQFYRQFECGCYWQATPYTSRQLQAMSRVVMPEVVMLY